MIEKENNWPLAWAKIWPRLSNNTSNLIRVLLTERLAYKPSLEPVCITENKEHNARLYSLKSKYTRAWFLRIRFIHYTHGTLCIPFFFNLLFSTTMYHFPTCFIFIKRHNHFLTITLWFRDIEFYLKRKNNWRLMHFDVSIFCLSCFCTYEVFPRDMSRINVDWYKYTRDQVYYLYLPYLPL